MVSVPLRAGAESYFEQFNVNWALDWRTPHSFGFVQFGGAPAALPPFGGFRPGAGLEFGLARQWGNGSFSLNLSAAQGRSSTLTMNAPSVMMMNGVPGFIQSGTVRPFVTGLIPVVGAYPVAPRWTPYPVAVPVRVSPLVAKFQRLQYEAAVGGKPSPAESVELLEAPADSAASIAVRGLENESSAQRGDIGVAEIRRLQAAEDAQRQQELSQLIEEGRAAERQGQWSIARVRYQQAAARSEGEQRRLLLRDVERLKDR
jgi:hypothetical protein